MAPLAQASSGISAPPVPPGSTQPPTVPPSSTQPPDADVIQPKVERDIKVVEKDAEAVKAVLKLDSKQYILHKLFRRTLTHLRSGNCSGY